MWMIVIVLNIIKKVYIYAGFLLFLHILCTVAWIVVFVVHLKKFLCVKDE